MQEIKQEKLQEPIKFLADEPKSSYVTIIDEKEVMNKTAPK